MEIISHRGNLDGPDPARENTTEAITGAMALGYPVEFDLRYHDGKFWLGHDEPQYPFEYNKLTEAYGTAENQFGTLYAHCKTVETLQRILEVPDIMEDLFLWDIVPFYHDVDECILLNNGLVWVHPRALFNAQAATKYSIFVHPELVDLSGNTKNEIYGVCTDFPNQLKANLAK